MRVRWGHSVADTILAWGGAVHQLIPLQSLLRQIAGNTDQRNLQNQRANYDYTGKVQSRQVKPRGWYPETETVPWGPLATWREPGHVATVDAARVSLSDIIRDFVAIGQPVVIRNALPTHLFPECEDAIRMWDKERFLKSKFAQESKYNAYRIPYG